MSNTTINTLDSEDFKIIYEFVNIESNLSDNNLDKKCKQFKYECDLLKNELYSKNNIINNLNEKILDSDKTTKSLLDDNEILKNENKNLKNEYNLLKDKYNDLEYNKLDIEEKYLEQSNKLDCITYLKNKITTLENENKINIVKYNDEYQKNELLNNNLKKLNKENNKINKLYNKSEEDYNTLKLTYQQINKEYKDLQKKYTFLSGNISNTLKNKHFKKHLYQCIYNKIKSEPYVINQIIDDLLLIIITKLNNK